MMAKPQPIVFYSWQNDLPSKTNRGLIRDALEGACKALGPALKDVRRVDSDTQGMAGSVDIANAVLEKIEAATVVVDDVSIIGITPIAGSTDTRPTPNPNVLYEYGYAKARARARARHHGVQRGVRTHRGATVRSPR